MLDALVSLQNMVALLYNLVDSSHTTFLAFHKNYTDQ